MRYEFYIFKALPLFIGIFLTLFLICFAYVSYKEKEFRAMRRALVLAVFLPLPYLSIAYINPYWQPYFAGVLLAAVMRPGGQLCRALQATNPLSGKDPWVGPSGKRRPEGGSSHGWDRKSRPSFSATHQDPWPRTRAST